MPATRPPSSGLPEGQLEIVRSENEPFKIAYDKLVIAVGAYSQSISSNIPRVSFSCDVILAFNVPGVKENAHFLKDVKDARRIRSRILECHSIALITLC
jgi:NADH dehydrogenase FAD-containing subunit